MTITIHLSTESIQNAISALEKVKENIKYGLQQTVEILTKDGEAVASFATGSMADISGEMIGETKGRISESGKAALIAEFGAGDATIVGTLFEQYPDTPIFPGSYSLLRGKRQYWDYGWWFFGGNRYTEVQPRQGLFQAKEYIRDNAIGVAQEVIKL